MLAAAVAYTQAARKGGMSSTNEKNVSAGTVTALS